MSNMGNQYLMKKPLYNNTIGNIIKLRKEILFVEMRKSNKTSQLI